MTARQGGKHLLAALVGALLPLSGALAGPLAYPGHMRFRHQLQFLKDTGQTDALVTTWPVSRPDVAKDLTGKAPKGVAFYPLRNQFAERLHRTAHRGFGHTELSVAAGDEPILLRTFEDTPRGRGEVEARADWMGQYFAARLQAQAVRDPDDDKSFRLDGSYGGAVLGNWAVTLGPIPRWWGPGWNGSLILSNNARPVPALALDRNYTDAFDLPVLRWLGPWDLSAFIGRLEEDRTVSHAKLIGARLAFQPLSFLELGISRTAQWGGAGRPQDLESFKNLVLGNDNVGSGGITRSNEPGNQLGGFDFRLTSPFPSFPVALYGQAIGEDENSGRPFKWMGLAGLETWGIAPGGIGTFRLYAEVAETALLEDGAFTFNTALEHSIYRSGYRFFGRSLGHPADNDTTLASLGGVYAHPGGMTWHGILRWGQMNRDRTNRSAPGGNPLFPDGANLYGGYLSGGFPLPYGTIQAGVEVSRIQPDQAPEEAKTETNVFLRWTWPGRPQP